MSADELRRIKRAGATRAQGDPQLLSLLREVAREKHDRIPHADGDDPEDLFGDWLADSLLKEGRLHAILDKADTPGGLRGLALKEIDQYWAGVRRRDLLPRLRKRIEELLSSELDVFEVRMAAARPGDVCWTLAARPASALFSERDSELYAHVSALNLRTIEEGAEAAKQTQFLTAAELRRYVVGMLDGTGRALSLDQLMRALQIYYRIEPTIEELPDENALQAAEGETYLARASAQEQPEPIAEDAFTKGRAMLAALTPRQQTILAGLLKGCQQAELAGEVGVSPAMVSAEVRAIGQVILAACPERAEQPEMLHASGVLLGTP